MNPIQTAYMAENIAYDLAAGLISREVLEEGWDFVSFVRRRIQVRSSHTQIFDFSRSKTHR